MAGIEMEGCDDRGHSEGDQWSILSCRSHTTLI